VVARVRVSDVGNETVLVYGLEHSTGFNIVQENEDPLPFTIDENGRVTTNTSLTNKVQYYTIIVIKNKIIIQSAYSHS
jgi:pheromone shutdown protein TraB